MKVDELLLNYIQTEYKDILDLNNTKQCKINIDYTLLNNYFIDHTGKQLFNIPNYNKILKNVEAEINKNNTRKNWRSIKISDVPPNCELHDLDATWNGDTISAKALIKNIAPISVNLKTAVYECRSCMKLIRVNITDNNIIVPTVCPECAGKNFQLLQDVSEYRNYRYVKLEEPLELRSGGDSREFKAYMQDYLASPYHNLKAGDVVDILGEFKVEKTSKKNKDKDFEFVIDLHNIQPVNDAFEDYRLTDEDKQLIQDLSKQEDIYERLCSSIAPEIFGYDIVKEGLLLQLFEGYRPADDVFKSEVMDRWTIHILLIGDPAIGKSQLITALKNRTPKIIVISGTDTSQAGLTTSAVKDELTGSWTLEAGAVVLADTGLLCIDEFDKLSSKVQKSLNQPMEQLSISSAKAGLVQTMSARTSVLACANPKYSKFNPYKSIKEQIDIPDSTLSRFDLVFALNDVIDEDKDTMLAESLLNKQELMNKDYDLIDIELFKKYVTYAKLECFPVLNDEAKKLLIDYYVQTRKSASEDETAKPITARDLKALERLTIARAKTELRNEATKSDVECAIRIYSEALRTIGLEPATAGELQNVLSDMEIQVVSDAEQLIKAKMREYGITNVDNLILQDIKHEIALSCHNLNINKDKILEIALKNVKNEGVLL